MRSAPSVAQHAFEFTSRNQEFIYEKSQKMKGVRYTPYEHHSLKKAVQSSSRYQSQPWLEASDGYALLCTALQKQHTEFAKLLLTNGSRVNSESNNPSETPLHFAVENGDIEIIQMLLDRDANINALNIYGHTPFHFALVCKKMEIIRILLNRGAKVEATSRCSVIPMHIATVIGSEEIINLLLSKGANVNAKNADGKTALHLATKRGYSRIVEHLLAHGAYVNACDNRQGYTPLHLAARNGNKEIMQLLLSKRADVNAEAKDGATSLHFAVDPGEFQIAEQLLNYGANVNAVYNRSGMEEGYTPLHFAARNGSEEIIKLLLSKHADVNAEAKDGVTSLHIAIDYSYEKIAKHLLNCGANFEAVYNTSGSEEGYTPLHLAAENGSEEIIRLLLKFDANVDSTDENGLTALHIASKNDRKKIVTALLEHGSDATITSKQNYTALDLAMYPYEPFNNNHFFGNYGHVEVVEILKRHMIKIKAANLYVVNKDILSISSPTFGSDEELSDYQNECEKEIASIKREVINDNITLYDILTKSVRALARYATNESIVEAFRSDNYKTKFPIYASMLKRNFRRGEKEKEFMEKGDKIFGFLFSKNFPRLPPECIEKILSYLNYEDLI